MSEREPTSYLNRTSRYVQIANDTRNTTLATRCGVADSFWTRWRGLMGQSQLASGEGLLIIPEWSIHTFFMRFAIDVAFLDHEQRVLKLYPALPPNRPYAGAWGAAAVLELPTGVLAATATATGDQLRLIPREP